MITFKRYGTGILPEAENALGWVISASKVEAYALKNFALLNGDNTVRISMLCSMMQTSDNSPIVVNVRRKTVDAFNAEFYGE